MNPHLTPVLWPIYDIYGSNLLYDRLERESEFEGILKTPNGQQYKHKLLPSLGSYPS